VPTYQYACTACGEQLEAVQSFTDAPLTECPACGGALRKVFSAVGVVFKGSGFYKTDSRKSTSEKSGESTKTDTAAKTDSAPKSDAKSGDAKPAAATTSSTPAAKSA
jgi:putative FmdB family regulatory protein